MLLQGANAGAAVGLLLLLKLQCCRERALDGAVIGEGSYAAEEVRGEAGPLEGEGAAAKLGIGGGGEGGGVHASDAAEEAAVEGFGGFTGLVVPGAKAQISAT